MVRQLGICNKQATFKFGPHNKSKHSEPPFSIKLKLSLLELGYIVKSRRVHKDLYCSVLIHYYQLV